MTKKEAKKEEEVGSAEELRELRKSPEFKKLVKMVDSGKLEDISLLEEAKTVPVVRKPKMKGTSGNLFMLPEQSEETEEEEKR